MKIKETKTCGAFAWGPVRAHSGLMAIGSIAGAMSEDFNSDAYLEIRGVDVWDTNTTDMPVLGRIQIPDRVHRIDWSTHGGGRGILAGGFTDGTVSVWSADKIVEAGVPKEGADAPSEDDGALLCKISAHTSATKGCHFNPLDQTLLATGGADKEMKIFNLERPEKPMEVPAMGPNKPATHAGEITDLRWNPRFKHIIGTTTSNGQVSCCDLKSKKVTMTFNISPQGITSAATTLAWHPDVATQVAVARDDPQPVIQVWDLRKATAPIKEMRGHTKGVLSLAWCAEDASVMMSTGADGRTMCWNPVTGDLFGEMPEQDNWVFDCKWAPHTPAVICTASFDNSLSIFGAQDISTGNSGGNAPKWLSRPCSASFGFGGRISVLDKTDKSGKTIRITKTPTSDDSTIAKERTFCAQINKNPVNSTEGVDWINAKGWGEIGAAAAARVAQTKTPLMKFLGADEEKVTTKVSELTEAGVEGYSQDEKDFQETIAECVTAGKLVAAIDLCMVAGKFDDAFALAYITGDAQSKRVHAEFVARKSGKHRYAKYLGSIASGDFGALVEDAATLPWREVLSLYAAFAPAADFATHCNKLGDSLYAAGELESAVTCYVFGSNVDKVAQLQKETGKFDMQTLVQLLTVLEQSVGRQCTHEAFAQALASYAETLAFGGEFQSAAHYAQRAAQLGCKEAGMVAHRVQTHVGARAEPAFQVTPLPDATAMDCQMMASKQPLVHSGAAVAQQQRQQPVTTPAGGRIPQQQQQGNGQQQQLNTANLAQQQLQQQSGGVSNNTGRHVDPRAGGGGNQQQQPQMDFNSQPQQQQHQGNMQQPQQQQQGNYQSPTPPIQNLNQQNNIQNNGSNVGAVKRLSPVQQQPTGVTNNFGPTGGAQLPAHGSNNGSNTNVGNNNNMGNNMPPPVNNGSNNNLAGHQQHPANNNQMAQQQSTTNNGAPPPVQPPVQSTQPPVQAAAVTPPVQPVMPARLGSTGSISSLSRTGGGDGGKESAAEVDVSNVAPQYHGLIPVLQARVEKITEKRKRDTTEKAVVALLKKLNNNDVNASLGEMLVAWGNALQANPAVGAGKIPEWKVITEKHWDAIQPFFSVKFL